jgi:hypothetical protein
MAQFGGLGAPQMISQVSVAEGQLLNVAQLATGLICAHDVTRLLVTRIPIPEKIGPTCARILADTLARGAALTLARNAPFGRNRWMATTPPPALHFGPNMIQLFQWMLTTPLLANKQTPLKNLGPFSPAEEVVCVALIDSLMETGCEWALLRQEAIQGLPLVQLSFGFLLGRLGSTASIELPSNFYFEALHRHLVRNWIRCEKSKKSLGASELLAGAVFQERILDAIFARANTERRILEFLVDVARLWLDEKPDDQSYVPSEGGALQERVTARRAAACVLRRVATLKAFDEEHRSTRFIDDDYALAQSLVKSWERLKPAHVLRASETVTALEGL